LGKQRRLSPFKTKWCQAPFLKKGAWHILVWLFLLTLPFLSYSAEEESSEKFEVFQSIPNGKSLLASPQFVVLDDFNSGKLKNRRGALWQTKAPGVGALDLLLEQKDARNQHRGYSVKASFNLAEGEKASFQSMLSGLDVSQAKYFAFKCKVDVKDQHDFKGRLRFSLTDWRHKTVILDITEQCSDPLRDWEEVVLPISLFKALDLDRLFSVAFFILAKEEKVRGEFWFDEIAFFGFNDVGFESHRDNLVGFPKITINSRRRAQLQNIVEDDVLLKSIAYDTWKYFVHASDKRTHLVLDHIRLGDSPLAADYTSPTNIGMNLLAVVAAYDLGFLSHQEAVNKTKTIFKTLREMKRYKGFFYNFYDTKKMQITRSYISTVDMGWLAIAFVVIRQAFPEELGKEVTRFLDDFNFEELLDTENNQLIVGIDIPERNFGSYHYGLLVTEARATSFCAIGKGDLPRDHWWFLYRTLPAVWKWQTQVPKGKNMVHEGLDVFEGYYEYGKQKFVPSWGGSLFEFLMPTLVMKERELGPSALGRNNRIATRLHRQYALQEKKYPLWGISPAAITSGRRWDYQEFGIKTLGAKGYPDRGVITPHVSFLALDSWPTEAIGNIRRWLDYEAYGEYGFYDSINLRNKRVNTQYLALDQGMILVAISNYLTGGAIQERFHADSVGRSAEDLLMKESFFSS
jgi:hypothetical protein